VIEVREALPRSAYIHVPFCARRCFYCDFAVEANRTPPVGEWIEAVAREAALRLEAEGLAAPLPMDTVYVGGGTPSLLGTGAMARLREALAPHLAWEDGAAEWTCEANPESFAPELAEDWAAAGVGRISLGVQSFDSGVLRWMGRLHGPEGPARAVLAARAAGIEDVSVDLIFGLPERLGRDWEADLARALELEPTHISLYGLTAEPGAPLGRRVREGRERLAEEEGYAEQYRTACETLGGAGFEHYEVSNFALPGRRSRHNQVYWSGASYLAFGPGAHGYRPPRRWWNLRGWIAYRDALAAGHLPLDDQEHLDAAALDLERLWLGLRTDAGAPDAVLGERQRAVVQRWVASGLAKAGSGRVRLTTEGWLMLDELTVELSSA
jgi:oxygen-independent coproporphyrinogen III oxidase